MALLAMTAFTLAAPSFAAKSMFTNVTSVDEARARIAKLPENGALRKKAVLHSDLGTMLYRQAQMEDAARQFELALTFDTTRALRRHIYLFMGKSYESSGRLDKAISAYEEALTYDPKNWRRHRDLAGLYEQAKLYRKARDTYADARALNPREPSLWFVTARVYRKMGLYKEAEPFLAQAKKLGHDENAIHREKSMIFEHRGRPGDALAEWRKGAADSEAPEDIARMIYLCALCNDRDGGKAALERLRHAGASPETVQLYENLVELPPSGLEALLTSRGKVPELEALVGSFLADRSPSPDSSSLGTPSP